MRAASLPVGAMAVAHLDSGPCYVAVAKPWERGSWLHVRLPGGVVWQVVPGDVDDAPKALGGLGGEPLTLSPRQQGGAG